VLQQKTQKTTPASPSHHRITTTTPATENPKNFSCFTTFKPQKNFRGERNFRASKTPKNFQTESFVCFRRKSQRANSKERREKREQREEEREKISEEMRGEREIFGTKAVGGTVGSEKKY
jgi:hypothetical protein